MFNHGHGLNSQSYSTFHHTQVGAGNNFPSTPSHQQQPMSSFSPFSNFDLTSNNNQGMSPFHSNTTPNHAQGMGAFGCTNSPHQWNPTPNTMENLNFSFTQQHSVLSSGSSHSSSSSHGTHRRNNQHSIFTPSPPAFGQSFPGITPIRSQTTNSVNPTQSPHFDSTTPCTPSPLLNDKTSAGKSQSTSKNYSFSTPNRPTSFLKENVQNVNRTTTADKSPTKSQDTMQDSDDDEMDKAPPSAPKKKKPTRKIAVSTRRTSTSVYKNLFEEEHAFDPAAMSTESTTTTTDLNDSHYSIGSMFLETPSPCTPQTLNSPNGYPSTIKTLNLPSCIPPSHGFTPISQVKTSGEMGHFLFDNSDDEFMRPPPPRSAKSQIFNDFTLGMNMDNDIFDGRNDDFGSSAQLTPRNGPLSAPFSSTSTFSNRDEDELINDINLFDSPVSFDSKKRKALHSPSFHRFRTALELEDDESTRLDLTNNRSDSFFHNPKAKLKTK